MKICDTCKNEYDKCIEIISHDNHRYIFDCFECAIHKLAPVCECCKCKIIGHGLEENGKIYCCVHCAKKLGPTALKDRIE